MYSKRKRGGGRWVGRRCAEEQGTRSTGEGGSSIPTLIQGRPPSLQILRNFDPSNQFHTLFLCMTQSRPIFQKRPTVSEISFQLFTKLVPAFVQSPTWGWYIEICGLCTRGLDCDLVNCQEREGGGVGVWCQRLGVLSSRWFRG